MAADHDVVSPDQSRLMRDALRAAGGDVVYIEVKGAKHTDWEEEDEANAVVSVEMFLDKHLNEAPSSTIAMEAGDTAVALRSSQPYQPHSSVSDVSFGPAQYQ